MTNRTPQEKFGFRFAISSAAGLAAISGAISILTGTLQWILVVPAAVMAIIGCTQPAPLAGPGRKVIDISWKAYLQLRIMAYVLLYFVVFVPASGVARIVMKSRIQRPGLSRGSYWSEIASSHPRDGQ